MLRVGLTGGIGSGKSTVAKIFEVIGIPVYYADQAARNLMNEEGELKKAIIHHFGPASYTLGQLDRSYLASQVFNDKEKLQLLNSLVHPETIRDAEKWMHQHHGPYIIREAALIFEAGLEKSLDFVIGVRAPLAMRLERTEKRDRIPGAEVMKRILAQMDETEKMSRCDFVIDNDDSQPVLPQVLKLHQHLVELSGS